MIEKAYTNILLLLSKPENSPKPIFLLLNEVS